MTTSTISINPRRTATHCKRGHLFDVENTYISPSRACRSGYQRTCKTCARINSRTNAERWRNENPETWIATWRKHKLAVYGLTIEQYDEMLKLQQGLCTICHSPDLKTGKRLGVDHNHATGKVRGLLCWNCNNVLGKFDDDIDRFTEAARYLRENLDA